MAPLPASKRLRQGQQPGAGGQAEVELQFSVGGRDGRGIGPVLRLPLRIRRSGVELVSGDGSPPVIVGDEAELQVWGVVTYSFRNHLGR